jgi:hypothetical protein
MFRKILGLAVFATLAPAANLDFNNPTGTHGRDGNRNAGVLLACDGAAA